MRDAPPGTRFFGRVDRRELLERMERSHLLLVTSVREGWGLVVTEANSLGTPALAYDVPGLRDSVVNRVTGMLTEPRPGALAEQASVLFRHSDTYIRLRDAALERAVASSWSLTANILLDFLTSSSSRVHSVSGKWQRARHRRAL